MTTSANNKTRTITLTGRAPVRIREDEWPVIASATERPGSFHNGTPVPDSETDLYVLRVRQHADGRTLVYGVVDAATAWTHTEDWRGGELLVPSGTGPLSPDDGRVVPDQEIAAAVARVGRGMPASVVRECIADLPAEDL